MADDQKLQPEPEHVGWRVLDPDGNVVQSGGVSIAQMDGRLAELLGLAQPTEEGAQE
jgi:hypothetical protein